MSAPVDPLVELREALRRFADERDWNQFHSPRNLAAALSVEAAELLEHYQWTDVEADPAGVREEIADVLLYLIRLADRLDIDLAAAAREKIELNARKYPVETARGNARKHSG